MEQKFEREMKMVKKSLIVLVALLLVTTVNAGIVVTPGAPGDDGSALKSEGSDDFSWSRTFYWPHSEPVVTWEYTALDICTIPVCMEVGMYIEIIDCETAKIVMNQVDCGDSANFPCYEGETTVHAVSNFDAELGLNTSLTTVGEAILPGDSLTCGITAGGSVPNDGNVHDVTIGCAAKNAKLYKHAPGSEVHVADVTITVKPASGY